MADTMVITGTRKGIGKFLAERYLDAGWNVAGCSRRTSSIEHERYSHHCLDVADEKAVRKMVREVRKEHGSIEALINNAGIASMNAFALTPKSTVDRVFDTNFGGTFLFAREVGKAMIRNKRGRIVNFTTVAAPLRLEGEAVYAASKAAVESLTQILAHELGNYGITVNAIGPTPVRTDLIKLVPEEKLEELLDRQAIRRFGTEEDVANIVDFYLQPGSEFVTGQIMYLGGVVG